MTNKRLTQLIKNLFNYPADRIRYFGFDIDYNVPCKSGDVASIEFGKVAQIDIDFSWQANRKIYGFNNPENHTKLYIDIEQISFIDDEIDVVLPLEGEIYDLIWGVMANSFNADEVVIGKQK